MTNSKRKRLKPVLHTKAGVSSKILATYVATSFDRVRATCIFELAALPQKTQNHSFEPSLNNSYGHRPDTTLQTVGVVSSRCYFFCFNQARFHQTQEKSKHKEELQQTHVDKGDI